MASDMTDVLHGEYLESLHEQYVAALEAFASSKNLEEMKENIAKLREAANEWGPDGFDGNEGLEKALAQITTLESIHDELKKSQTISDRRFRIGTVLAVSGILLSALGVYLSINGVTP